MTPKSKKTKNKKTKLRTGNIARLHASVPVQDELFRFAEENTGPESR